MNHTSNPNAPALTAQDATKLIDDALSALDQLKNLLDEETAHIRTANLKDAIQLEAHKTQAAQNYMAALEKVSAQAVAIKDKVPSKLEQLQKKNTELSRVLSLNLTVLATAKSVSEGIIQEVAEAVTRRERPATYGPRGTQVQTKTYSPLAVSKLS
jgi:flagellar biosynthesis/type III secretory pathway chaperone